MTKIILGSIVLAVVLAWWIFSVKRRRRSRHNEVERISKTLGSYMEEYGPETSLLEATGLPFFLETHNCVGKNLFHFKDDGGIESYFFDYACVAAKGAQEEQRECTVALFDLKKDALPAFCLSSDGTGSAPQTAGFELVNLKPVEGMPPGAKIYCGDGPRMMALFTPARTALFAAEPDWNAQGSGKYLLLYKEGRLVHASAYHAFMASARALAAGLSA